MWGRWWDLLGGEVDNLTASSDSRFQRFREIDINVSGGSVLAEPNAIGCIRDGWDDLADWEELALLVTLVEVLT